MMSTIFVTLLLVAIGYGLGFIYGRSYEKGKVLDSWMARSRRRHEEKMAANNEDASDPDEETEEE